ncbi:hypothetical protein C8R46DRAFT_1077711 [Mycena filopes]|nr:hypothetical protein C8R46DRAFT_1077711 [Mycena filopes]
MNLARAVSTIFPLDGDNPHLTELPIEENTIFTAKSAQKFLDCGYTMCVGTASARELVIKNAEISWDLGAWQIGRSCSSLGIRVWTPSHPSLTRCRWHPQPAL